MHKNMHKNVTATSNSVPLKHKSFPVSTQPHRKRRRKTDQLYNRNNIKTPLITIN